MSKTARSTCGVSRQQQGEIWQGRIKEEAEEDEGTEEEKGAEEDEGTEQDCARLHAANLAICPRVHGGKAGGKGVATPLGLQQRGHGVISRTSQPSAQHIATCKVKQGRVCAMGDCTGSVLQHTCLRLKGLGACSLILVHVPPSLMSSPLSLPNAEAVAAACAGCLKHSLTLTTAFKRDQTRFNAPELKMTLVPSSAGTLRNSLRVRRSHTYECCMHAAATAAAAQW
jgi:hypothetical protein